MQSYFLRTGFIFWVLFFCFSGLSKAQTRPIDYANEYFAKEDYKKALEYYSDLAKDLKNTSDIYTNYTTCLKKENKQKELLSYLERLIKKLENNHAYHIDYILLNYELGDEKTAEKEKKKFIKSIVSNPSLVDYCGTILTTKSQWNFAEELYLTSRKEANNPLAHADELSQVYVRQGRINDMLEEQFALLRRRYVATETIEQTLQNNLTSAEDLNKLEAFLFARIQEEPNFSDYNEVLCWLYLQRKQFSKAFFQAKAIDKSKNTGEPNKLLEVGQIAIEHQDFNSAIEIFEYIIKEFSASKSYATARKNLINAKEELVKAEFPVDTNKVKSLIEDYKSLVNDVGVNTRSVENFRNIARLRAFYLNQIDTAIALLEYVVAFPRISNELLAWSKLDLGDFYILKGEPWESTLLYSQVEKAEKMTPIGHEAKLRNAKLSYFKGEFQLAQDHLDVLKLATSREISNDAMYLSIRIQDNSGLDSNYDAMEDFAAVELEVFRKNYAKALSMLDTFLKVHPWHALTDDVYWMKAEIYQTIRNWTGAIEELQKIQANYGTDLYGDDSYFRAGVIYEDKLADNEKAMEMYKKVLFDYTGSIFTVEARKRLRNLRGDFSTTPTETQP